MIGYVPFAQQGFKGSETLMFFTGQSTHAAVKSKILERMAEWSEMFSKEPDLGIMEQAYYKLKSQSILFPS